MTVTRYRRLCSLLTLACAAVGSGAASLAVDTRPVEPVDVRMDASTVLGAGACVKCHAAEVEVWKSTPHYHTFEQLHRRGEAQEIARRLGIRSIKYDDRCIQCHYTQKQEGGDVLAVSGVSCESCHGPARDWLEVHHDYGGPGITRETESAAHRAERIAAATQRGMRNPHNVYRLAQSCYRCHTVPDEELVNVGGHKAGSLDFEIVSWSQGTLRHNFAHSEGTANSPRSGGRLCVLFAAGLIADLEYSLRAVSKATVKEAYGVTSAQRAARAAARLRSAYQKTEHPALGEVLEVYAGVQLRLNNQEELTAAAERISAIGIRLGEQAAGHELEALAPFIPAAEHWK